MADQIASKCEPELLLTVYNNAQGVTFGHVLFTGMQHARIFRIRSGGKVNANNLPAIKVSNFMHGRETRFHHVLVKMLASATPSLAKYMLDHLTQSETTARRRCIYRPIGAPRFTDEQYTQYVNPNTTTKIAEIANNHEQLPNVSF